MKRGISILLFAILVSGCMKHESLYNESKDREEAEKNFPVQNIDPNHDWAMAASRTLNVSMNEKTGKTYTVKLYNGYPFNTESDVRLLAQQQVKDGSTAIIKFDAPKVLERIFVMRQLDDEYVMRVSKLENEQFTVTFGAMEGRSARAASASRAVDVSKYAIFDEKAQQITDGNQLKNLEKGVWYVDSEIKYEAKIEWSPGTCLYIKEGGRLILNNELKLQGTDSFISVLEGGYLAIDGEFKLNGDNGSNGLTVFYNAGTVNADDVELEKGLFINEGTFNADDFEVDKDGEVWNSCRLIITGGGDGAKFELKKNAVFNNEGYVHVTQGGAEWGEDDDDDGVVVSMVGNAVFHIAQKLDIEEEVKVIGTNGKPLIVADKLDFDEDASVVGTIYVSAKKVEDVDELPKNVNIINTSITDNGGCTVNSILNPVPEVLPAVTTCAFEDMISESTDYDFNDVVFQVSNPINNKIKIILVAAGSTRAITAEYSLDKGKNYTQLIFNGEQEVHAAFGKPVTEMVNTATSITTPASNSPFCEITAPPVFSFVEQGKIRITVEGSPTKIVSSGDESKVEMEERGKVPYALCVPIAWAYPTERTGIDKAYDHFGEWGQKMESYPDWYIK